MKFSLFNNYGALNSKPAFAAFQRGLQNLGIESTTQDMSADVAVIWSVVWAGRMKQNRAVWDHFRSQGKPVVVLEVGMLQRGITWKVGVNGTVAGSYSVDDLDNDRPGKLGVNLKPWKTPGDDIVIACQRSDSEQWAGKPSKEEWLKQTVDQLRQHTDRHIVIRSHPRQEVLVMPGCTIEKPIYIPKSYDDFDFNHALEHAWAIVNWNSGPGSQAVINGVPAFVGPDSLAAPVANLDFADIEKPNKPDRDNWLIELAHTEWTIEEIATGVPISRLFPI